MMGMGMGMGAPEVAVDPVIEEEAAAVGDPHMTLTSGESDDLCCESGVCKPCPVALLQVSDYYSYYYYESLLQADEDDLGMGMGMMGMMGMGKMGMMGMGMMGMGKMGMMGMGKMGMMGMGMMGMGAPEIAVEPVIEDEAAAVGDPQLTLTSGESDDLCCESGVCKTCPVALLQVSDYYSYYYYESLLQADEDDLGMGMGMMGMGMMGMAMMGMGKMGMMGMGKMG